MTTISPNTYPYSSVKRWLFTTNHKDIGILYFVTSLYFLVLGGALAFLIRAQLAQPAMGLLTPGPFNQAITVHGLIMVLWFLSPLAFAFANYFVPLQIGAKDMAFPRLNAMSYWMYLFGGLLAAVGFFTPGGAIDTGWTVYAPLSTVEFSGQLGVTLGGAGLLMLIASATLGSINFIVTIINSRAPGMTLLKMPMFTWSIFFTVLMMLFAFPSLGAGVLMLAADRILGTVYFSSAAGGAILWTHMFWFFGHPEVYIVLLPALGAVAEIIPVFARKPLYGKKIIIGSIAAATVMSFIVWVHHMFMTGVNPLLREVMTLTTEAISVPFGIITISFIMTLVAGSIRFKTPMLFALGSIGLFLLGGITGVFNSSVALDFGLRGTYWIVGHFHYTLVGGATTGLIAAIYYWFPKMTGRMYSERLGKIHFVIYFLSFNLLYFPMQYLIDMPRRVSTYGVETGWGDLNLLTSIAGFVFGASILILFFNLIRSVRYGAIAGRDPWGAWSPEWMVDSPPEEHTWVKTRPIFTSQGTITIAPVSVADSSGTAPTTSSHEAQQDANVEDTHVSYWPLVMTIGTFVFLLGVGFGLVTLLTGAGIFLVALVGFGRDNLQGRFVSTEPLLGQRWPFEGIERVKMGMWVFLASEIVLFGALASSYIYVRLHSPTWPAAGTVFDIENGAILTFLLLTSSLTAVRGLAAIQRGNQNRLRFWLLATFGYGVLFLFLKGGEWLHLFEEGITFGSGLPATTFFVTTGAHAAHVIVGLIVLTYIIIKSFTGRFTKENHAGVEYFGLYWHFVDTVWIFLFPLFYLI